MDGKTRALFEALRVRVGRLERDMERLQALVVERSETPEPEPTPEPLRRGRGDG